MKSPFRWVGIGFRCPQMSRFPAAMLTGVPGRQQQQVSENRLLPGKNGSVDMSGIFFHSRYGSIFVPSTFKKAASQEGCAGQAGAVTRLPSVWD
jgi:hypothetical protein